MKATRTLSVRIGSLGGALALVAAGLAGTVGLVAAGGPAGADSAPFSSNCTLVTGPTVLSAVVGGSISPDPVQPGGAFTAAGLELRTSLAVATQVLIPGATFSGTFTTNITAAGATPASQSVSFTIPATSIPAHPTVPLPLVAKGSIGTLRANAGATSVALSTATVGSLNVVLNGAAIPPAACTQPAEVITSAPVAVPAGTVTAVLPNSGPTAGGTSVTIHGANLGGPTAVDFGGVPARSFSGRTANSIVAVAPAGSGTVNVHVKTSAGSSSSNPGDLFTYTNGPIVNRVSPSSSTPAGGNRVTITGLQLSGATAVHFGSAPATSFAVNSATSITAVAPVGSGVVNVTVTGPQGTSVVSQLDHYSYRSGFYLPISNGGVLAYGFSPYVGSAGQLALHKPIVGMATTPDGGGYWLVATDGGIFAFGDAGFYGSTGGITLNQPIVGMAPTPDGFGYWLVAADGGVFSFGDAVFYGSTGSIHLNKPIVGMASSATGNGYWLVASDGGIFAFGDAAFHGSTGGLVLRQPAVAMAATPDGGGYWIATADGGVFTFGDATFHGSQSGIHLNKPILGMASSPDGGGYWLVASDGGVFSYGDAPFFGSAAGIPLEKPIVGIAAVG